MTFSILAGLMGGLGLFLLGMRLMTNGLRKAAGAALRHILSTWTKTPARGIVSGFAITALVQSSSAVTVAAIGFVNAGLINLQQSIGVIFGSNIGTTITGWLVAAIGFNVEIKALALPLIGIGALLRLTGGNSRRTPVGDALTGFGLFFLGIEILKNSFQNVEPFINFGGMATDGITCSIIFLGAGFLLTFLMQSSSAAMAIVLTAAASDIIGIDCAAAAVIGTNIGTTSTAALSVIGATDNAKKVAAAHILFNIGTGVVALAMLPLLVGGILGMEHFFSALPSPAITLAVFHTVFNLFGVLLFTPFTSELVRFLDKKIGTDVPEVAKPRYLDNNILKTPSLALDALFLELGRTGEHCRLMAQKVLATNYRYSELLRDLTAIRGLIGEIRKFCTALHKEDLPNEVAENLPKTLRVLQYYSNMIEVIHTVSRDHVTLNHILPGDVDDQVYEFKMYIKDLLNIAHTPCSPEFESLQFMREKLSVLYKKLKDSILDAGANGRIEIEHMVELLEFYSKTKRLITQAIKATSYWASMKDPSEICKHATEENDYSWRLPETPEQQ
ncbi:Na/Pi cotransporter family protein [Salidesulfovibrio onnuriiensis]|uniref:Na/Pi cotransporter family protein n=1 Tax=Salidesulfovibrio onnuriiensis TaxID=2583823 RepID=UPI0011CCB02A|nr:Na/Pi cotransporter family protein [Salidesulfovibrio onnuriiensis]